jgi:hypothetical protein
MTTKIPKPSIELSRAGTKLRKKILDEIQFNETHDFAL